VNPRMFLQGWAGLARVIGYSIAGSLLLATGAWAQVTFTVNSTDDDVDANVLDGKCEIPAPAPPGTCTLRAAVMQANRMPNGGAIIQLPAGLYKLSIPASIADGEENGDLNLTEPSGYAPGPTIVTGAGAATTIIDGNGIDRVLHIDGSARSVTISGVSIVNGLRGSSGGGIYNESSLILRDCIVSHNTVSYGNGGGIFTTGYLDASGVTLDDNTAQSYGGGIYNLDRLELSKSFVRANKASSGAGIYNAGIYFPYSNVDSTEITGNIATGFGGGIANVYSGTALNITRSTVSNNTTGTYGGGVENDGVLYASNSTISGNSAKTYGGGFYNRVSGNSNIYNSTIAYNQADSDADSVGAGAGIYNYPGGTFNIRNSVVAGNYLAGQPDYDDCDGALGIYGKNRLGEASACTYPGGNGTVSVLQSLDELGVLRDNGGPTRTIALIPPSDMIDVASACLDQNGNGLATDQRGRSRIVGASCDIGALELDAGDIFFNGFE